MISDGEVSANGVSVNDLSVSDIVDAQQRISKYVNRTPILTSERIDEIVGARLFFKCEHLQKVGAFKARGAANAVFSFAEDVIKTGVATHSSGNHGAALARAASLRKMPSHIVVPENANPVKVDAIKAYGANIIFCEPNLAARESKLAEVIQRTGATMVHPYDDPLVIAGQGTTALEVLAQMDENGIKLDAFVTPVGGGGLLSGSALALRSLAAEVAVFGAEPQGADDAYRSFKAGVRITEHQPNTIADGLRTTLGALNFEIIGKHVDDILLVSESEIIASMALIWTRMKQVVEPSSAVTLAAVMKFPELFRGKNVCLVLTGGNVDLGELPF